MLWHSQDFGLGAIISLVLAIIFTNIYDVRTKVLQLKYFFLGILIGITFYPIFLKLTGHHLQIEYVAFFTRQFGSGFGAIPITLMGPVLIIFPVIFLILYFHIKINAFYRNTSYHLLQNSFIGLFFSFFIIVTFPYFINRSIASGQLQIFLLPISISLGSLLGTFSNIGFFKTLNSFVISKKLLNLFLYSPLLIIFSLPFSTLSLFPNPSIELPRILGRDLNSTWPPNKLKNTLDNVELASQFAHQENVTVAYFGSFSNYIALEKKIEVANLYNSPFDFLISSQSYDQGCSYLRSINSQYLILDYSASETFKIVMDITKKSNFCDAYVFSNILQIEPYFFAERLK
jgi:hypothetical protein